jgi:probable HAF family extracellular repeat protein
MRTPGTRSTCRVSIAGLCLCAGLFFTVVADPPRYHVIDLGARLAGEYHILDMNDKNQVVGYVKVDSLRRAFVWKNATLIVLPSFCDSCEGIAEGINDAGNVVGYAYTQPGTGKDDFRIFHAVKWDTAGRISDLGTMGGNRSAAFDINRSGQIAGFYGSMDSVGGQQQYREHVYLWEKDSYRVLGIGPGIAGRDETGGYTGVSVARNGNPFSPSMLSASWRLVDEITLNNNGDVASCFASNSDSSYSILWTHEGTQVDLNKAYDACPFPCWSLLLQGLFIPTNINDSVKIAGYEMYWGGGGFRPLSYDYLFLVWLRSDAFYDIISPNYSQRPDEVFINNKGTIAGSWHFNYSENSIAAVWEKDSAYFLDDYIIRDTTCTYQLDRSLSVNDSGAIAVLGFINHRETAMLLVPESPKIVMPVLGKFTITLIQASAKLVSDVYLYRPDSVLMIQNNLKNVGKTYDTAYPAGTALEFAICVHPPAGKGVPYWFTSDSKHSRVIKANDSLWYINFEDLPDSVADWDYNDVVLKVELHLLGPLPSKTVNPDLSKALARRYTGWVDAYDLRGRFIGSYYLNKGHHSYAKGGFPAYGVHIILPKNNNTKVGNKKLLILN